MNNRRKNIKKLNLAVAGTTAVKLLGLICRLQIPANWQLLLRMQLNCCLPVALALSLGFACGHASATKLNAQPLPREREAKSFDNPDSETVIAQPSRFKRRPDYREVDAQKQKDADESSQKAEEAKRKAAEESKRLQSEASDNYKKRQEMAVAANNKAVLFGKKGLWTQAISAHEQAVQLDPASKQFRINLSAARVEYGKTKLAAGDLNAAAGCFRKALAAAQDNGLAGRLLAATMSKQGRDPLSIDVRLATGDQLGAIGDWEGASIEYQAAMQLEPSARTYTKVGDMALRFGQVGTATNWYRQSLIKDPDYAPAHRQLGLLALAQKDYTAAAASLRKAVILDPHDNAAGQALVEIWRKQVSGNPLLAENHLGLAGALQLTGDYFGADSEYRRLEALAPKDPSLESGRASLSRTIQHDKADRHRLAAETLFNQGLHREALAEISQAVMLEPRSAKYQFLLGECLETNGDYQGAHQAYLTCVLIDPENNKEAAARMKQMQNAAANPVSFRQKTQPQAVQQQGSPFEAAPQPAFGLPKKDMFEAAPAALPELGAPASQQNLESAPAAAAATPAPDAVTAAEGQRDFAKAVQLLRELVGGRLQDAEIHHRLAVNLLNSGDIDEAVSEFRIASALSPGKKEFADDLAQAMIIHKRSHANQAGSQDSSINAGASR